MTTDLKSGVLYIEASAAVERRQAEISYRSASQDSTTLSQKSMNLLSRVCCKYMYITRYRVRLI